MVCSRHQSVEVDCEDYVVPPVKFFGAVRFEPIAQLP